METRRRRITGWRIDSNMRRICRYLPCLSVTVNQELLPGFTNLIWQGASLLSERRMPLRRRSRTFSEG